MQILYVDDDVDDREIFVSAVGVIDAEIEVFDFDSSSKLMNACSRLRNFLTIYSLSTTCQRSMASNVSRRYDQRQPWLSLCFEVDQHVLTTDHIDTGEWRIFQQVMRRENANFPN